jgi:hypothetical protein
MKTLLIITGIIAFFLFLFFLYSLCRMSGKASEAEERIHLAAWRKGLQRNDLAQCEGVTYWIESNDGKVCECRTYSDTRFILLTNLYPVE